MRRLNVIAAAAAAVIVILVVFGVTLDDYASSSPSYSQTTSSTCTLFLVSGGFTATASATSARGTCAPLTGIIDVLGCPPTTNSSSSDIACPGPQFASFSATGSSATAVVPHGQRIEIDLFGGLPMLQCASPNCSSSASLVNSTLYSCCRLADQFIFSAPGDYNFTASWTPGTFGLTACTFVSYSTVTSAGSVASTPYCTSASGTSSVAYSSTQQATFVLSVAG
jgi:hypothetical protein